MGDPTTDDHTGNSDEDEALPSADNKSSQIHMDIEFSDDDDRKLNNDEMNKIAKEVGQSVMKQAAAQSMASSSSAASLLSASLIGASLSQTLESKLTPKSKSSQGGVGSLLFTPRSASDSSVKKLVQTTLRGEKVVEEESGDDDDAESEKSGESGQSEEEEVEEIIHKKRKPKATDAKKKAPRKKKNKVDGREGTMFVHSSYKTKTLFVCLRLYVIDSL